MLFGQLCGYPWVITIEHRLWHHMLASPSYSPECCQGSDDEGKVAAMSKKQLSNNDVEEPRSRQSGDGEMMSILYRSFIVVQANSSYSTIADLKGATFAVNEVRSNSGYNFPRYLFKDHAHKGSFFANVTVTGSHSTSLKDVQQGLVDAAAIDCVTFSLFAKHDPEMVQGNHHCLKVYLAISFQNSNIQCELSERDSEKHLSRSENTFRDYSCSIRSLFIFCLLWRRGCRHGA